MSSSSSGRCCSGRAVLGYNRSYNAIQIKRGVIFDESLLYRVTHYFGQMLTHPTGDVMHAFVVNRLNEQRQMAGFNLRNIHRANRWENVAFQAGEDLIGVRVRLELKTTGVPCGGDVLKGVGFIDSGVIRFADQGREWAGR